MLQYLENLAPKFLTPANYTYVRLRIDHRLCHFHKFSPLLRGLQVTFDISGRIIAKRTMLALRRSYVCFEESHYAFNSSN